MTSWGLLHQSLDICVIEFPFFVLELLWLSWWLEVSHTDNCVALPPRVWAVPHCSFKWHRSLKHFLVLLHKLSSSWGPAPCESAASVGFLHTRAQRARTWQQVCHVDAAVWRKWHGALRTWQEEGMLSSFALAIHRESSQNKIVWH